METIEERFKSFNLHSVQKKGDELSSQEYDKDRTGQYKKSKGTLPNTTYPDMIEICKVRDEFTDDTSPVLMEDCVNKNLDEPHRDTSEHDILVLWIATTVNSTSWYLPCFWELQSTLCRGKRYGVGRVQNGDRNRDRNGEGRAAGTKRDR